MKSHNSNDNKKVLEWHNAPKIIKGKTVENFGKRRKQVFSRPFKNLIMLVIRGKSDKEGKEDSKSRRNGHILILHTARYHFTLRFFVEYCFIAFPQYLESITSLSSEKICIKFLHPKKENCQFGVNTYKITAVQKAQLTNFNLRFSLLLLLL